MNGPGAPPPSSRQCWHGHAPGYHTRGDHLQCEVEMDYELGGEVRGGLGQRSAQEVESGRRARMRKWPLLRLHATSCPKAHSLSQVTTDHQEKEDDAEGWSVESGGKHMVHAAGHGCIELPKSSQGRGWRTAAAPPSHPGPRRRGVDGRPAME
jgi:hypothetical protein